MVTQRLRSNRLVLCVLFRGRRSTLSLAPYIVLTSHVLRVAAITLQTLAAGPFTIGPGNQREIVETQLDIEPETWDSDVGDEEGDP